MLTRWGEETYCVLSQLSLLSLVVGKREEKKKEKKKKKNKAHMLLVSHIHML